MPILSNQLHRRVWQADRRQSVPLSHLGGYSWAVTKARHDRSRITLQRAVAYRAAGQGAAPHSGVGGGAPTRNASSVLAKEAICIPKAQRSGHKHRSRVRLLCDPPRCATRPERGSVPESKPYLLIGMPYLAQRPAQHGIAADRCAREIVGILMAAPGALAAAECQTVGPQR